MSSTDKKTADLVTAFKRQGHFDALRKELLANFREGDDGNAFLARIKDIVEAEITRDESILAKDRTKATNLLGTAVERTEAYPDLKKKTEDRVMGSKELRERVEGLMRAVLKEQEEARKQVDEKQEPTTEVKIEQARKPQEAKENGIYVPSGAK
ncbi:hypothetical protein SAICODRAFT_5695 [Saitoella complicata NRRL Y-17804]|uniref:uncharacterized protein n=1 Tax=Saitoella complicata (strain BCRC 22490 / CBS 7301 / JCM 7358 / NBRC 10748 / NRRL Y-17804) TaxID=698492 RepID=UPI0008671C57|nr:uncharacterized protein SAICODRAFT_5695 [Saitoella complicata NRRL Y-17804]ODQ55087.1 hypothetical protein SAICODRAFT_5695 [Saitoella complicata NRRL Y-17804]